VSTDERRGSDRARLVRLGFVDPDRVARLLDSPAIAAISAEESLVAALADAPDPDQATLGLVRVLEAAEGAVGDGGADEATVLRAALLDDDALRERLTAVLGASLALTDHLVRHPDQWRELARELPRRSAEVRRSAMLRAIGADPQAPKPVAQVEEAAALDLPRREYRRQLMRICARDLTGAAAMPEIAGDLSDLASAALDTALAIARSMVDGSDECRLTVMAMGKCGARELNYISDVDVIFVAEAEDGVDETRALGIATRLATALMRICSTETGEGSLWEVDAGLRPEGKAGALVRTLSSHVGYYQRWAKTWEFQALLKARPAAGDLALGQAYLDALMPMVWSASSRDGFVEDAQAMRRRVESTLPAKELDRQLKLGPGGLRDVEFSVQLLQLVHGRDDFRLRSPSTLAALEALSTHGFVGRDDAAELDHAYVFLRTLEHRIQLQRLHRSHVVPDDQTDLRRIARSMGFRSKPVDELVKEWRQHQREVRRLHEKLFYRPLLNAVARLEPGQSRLTPEAAMQRLEALGYADPAGALRHIEALTSGVSRRATIQRALLPVLLGWFADAPDPDAGLLAFRQVSDELGSTPWYLRLLRDEGAAAERMARVLASSGYAADLLLRAPEATRMLADDDELHPRALDQLDAELDAITSRSTSADEAIKSVRAVRRRELFRTAVADVLGLQPVSGIVDAVSITARATVSAGLAIAVRVVEEARGGPLPTRFAVIGMGRFGGHELSYGGDADVVFVHDPLPGVDEKDAGDAALAVANELRRLLALPAPDPPLLVDADLRPEGRQGPLVRTLASFRAYYARWSLVWEAQALLRAEPVAGDAALGEEFVALIDPIRYPEGGLAEDDIREIRRIKARVEAERLPRGADPATHTKLGRGGLSDIEWTIQLIQLRHAHAVPGLRTTRTIAALEAADAAGLMAHDDAEALALAWRTATRARGAVMLVRGRAGDSLPTQAKERARVARLVDPTAVDPEAFLDDYLRSTRRARSVVERVFYG
jgi:[glutamine synthetase] adenylyltransferase / [glutamine synthetase]-adenylyl-L-tyrosine phosphorylase